MKTLTDTDRLNWLIETDNSGDFGSLVQPNVLSFSDCTGWCAYRTPGAPSQNVKYFPTAREAIDDAITNPRPRP